MAQPPEASSLPRHLQQVAQGASSSSAPAPASSSSSPSLNAGPLPSPSFNSSAPLPSPSAAPASSPSTNRFGLALGNLIQRRPRGNTNPSSMTGTRSPGGGQGQQGSPSSELPPSPGGGERSGYGFPALRRTLSKRAGSSQGGTVSPNGANTTTRGRRSSSQPPAPVGMQLEGSGSGGEGRGRPRTATVDTVTGGAAAGGGGLGLDVGPAAAGVVQSPSAEQSADQPPTTYRLRLVPHLESSRSLHFEPVDRTITAFQVLKVGRFTDRSHSSSSPDTSRIAFKSKVVSRGHAEIWADGAGKFHIRDTKSSSGTFLNHIRLSGPNSESRALPLKDGDVLQLGVDYQGGTEEIYRCVKMRVELNRGWQRSNNAFNTAALAQLRALGGAPTAVNGDTPSAAPLASSSSSAAAGPSNSSSAAAAAAAMATESSTAVRKPQATASVTDCCICLYPVTVCQALFIAPCSHVTHFKCIRPLIMQNYPGFCCPLCRTYADMEADVEIDDDLPSLSSSSAAPAVVDSSVPSAAASSSTSEEIAVPATVAEEPQLELEPEPVDEGGEGDDAMSSVSERSEPPSRATSIRAAASGSGSGSGLSRSRPASLREVPPTTAAEVPSSASPTTPRAPSLAPLATSIPKPHPRAASLGLSESQILASLASAATPPNSTFLSTLADGTGGRLPRLISTGAVEAPVSLHSALAEVGAGSEEETEGEGRGKGKGKGRAREEEEDEAMDEDAREGEGSAATAGGKAPREEQPEEDVRMELGV